MTGLNHGLTGAVIALAVKNPYIAVPAAFLSHFVVDVIPHWDYGASFKEASVFSRKFNLFLTSDFLISVLAMVILGITFPAHKWLIWACMIAAASPDLMWAYYRLYVEHLRKQVPSLGPIARFHDVLQWSHTAGGLYVEIIWAIFMIGLLAIVR